MYIQREIEDLHACTSLATDIARLEPFKNLPDYGDSNIPVPGKELISYVLAPFKELAQYNLDGITLDLSSMLLQTLKDAHVLLLQVEQFNQPRSPDGERLLNQLLSNIQQNFKSWHTIVIRAIVQAQRGEVLKNTVSSIQESLLHTQTIQNSVSDQREEIDKWFVDSQSKVRELGSRVEQRMQVLEELAEQIGVKHQAIRFEKEAIQQERLSKMWWYVMCATAAYMLVYMMFFLEPSLKELLRGQSITAVAPLLITKTIFFSVLSFMLFVASRNFSACQHNSTVNRHRQNALSTFELFVASSATDPDVKRQVLLAATHAIFESQPSGYLKAANQTSHPIVQIGEMKS